MTISSSTEFTPRDGRRFAFPVGLAFLALAGLFLWRNVDIGSLVCGVLGGALLVAGLLLPGKLGPVERGWMKLALAISFVTTPIFLAVVYFLVLTPTGIALRLLGKNPIARHVESGGFWHSDHRTRTDMHRQF